jgi:hypothetical protein
LSLLFAPETSVLEHRSDTPAMTLGNGSQLSALAFRGLLAG